ncbi:MAG: exodeoxyribonuclease VII small subunit [Patescibacteria group bacterium]
MIKKEQSLKELMVELEELTAWFEGVDLDLEVSLGKYERALAVAELCRKKLEAVENKVITLKNKYRNE